MGHFLIFFAFAFIFTWLLLPLFQFLGTRYNITVNAKERIYPQKNLSLLGGAALYFGFIFTLLLYFAWDLKEVEISMTLGSRQLLAILIGAALISIVGLVEDIYKISFPIKVFVQVISAIILVVAPIKTDISFIKLGASFDIGNILLTVLWVVFIINMIKWLEAFDGMVIALAAISSMFLFAIAIFGYDYGNAFLCLTFAGSLLALLWDQLPPAKFGLGQMGSGFIGFMLAALTLNLQYSQKQTLAMFIPVMLMMVPITVGLLLLFFKSSGKNVSPMSLWSGLKKTNFSGPSLLFITLAVTVVTGFLSLLMFFWASTILACFCLLITFGLGGFTAFQLTRYDIVS